MKTPGLAIILSLRSVAFAATGLPSGLGVNTASGMISGKPGEFAVSVAKPLEEPLTIHYKVSDCWRNF